MHVMEGQFKEVLTWQNGPNWLLYPNVFEYSAYINIHITSDWTASITRRFPLDSYGIRGR